eukprot:CAMPEP_0113478784 /NCGR_PEP_ID=MMETSP0014_2-20120614/20945_1 /TAXON_ID=2857 /ORGANISM="Nitzschia sp." /LENGTH=463 /DNA_ID=CAMNT_0000372007 /DNA_START=18 /DNA_END=1409 /DNA_ORIENTATION=- /assembly_acc=CAM_ASM_000159
MIVHDLFLPVLVLLLSLATSTEGWVLSPSSPLLKSPRGGSQLYSNDGDGRNSKEGVDDSSSSGAGAVPSTLDDIPVLRLPLLEAELSRLNTLATVATSSSSSSSSSATDGKKDGEWLDIFRKIDGLTVEINDIKTSAEFAIRRAQFQFYEAFSDGDVEAMRDIWSSTEPNENIRCIHPGMPCITGLENIMQSWEDILSVPPGPPPPTVTSELPFSSPIITDGPPFSSPIITDGPPFSSQQPSPESSTKESSGESEASVVRSSEEDNDGSSEEDQLPKGQLKGEGKIEIPGQQESSQSPPQPPPPPPPQQLNIKAEATQVQIHGITAIVSCIERMVPDEGSGGRGGGEDFECLNIYKCEGDEWKLISRMASPIMMMRGPPGPPPPGFEYDDDGDGGREFGGGRGRGQPGMGSGRGQSTVVGISVEGEGEVNLGWALEEANHSSSRMSTPTSINQSKEYVLYCRK